MGKRYFCDYCDRSFQDNLHNRKKHLNGVQHLRAKRAWYDLFRDAAAILQEEQTKKPCRKFLQTGQCDFGSNCRFSHMTEQDLEKLSAQVQGEQRSKELQQEGADVPPGTIEDWLEKRAKRLSAAQSNRYRLAAASGPHRAQRDRRRCRWSELSLHTRPASTACLLSEHATDTHMAPVLCAHIRDVSPRAAGAQARPGCLWLLPWGSRARSSAWQGSATVVLSY
ncbi:zinc finger matrin-type protein 5 isoform 3-T5 [Amazona ochrocephala]